MGVDFLHEAGANVGHQGENDLEVNFDGAKNPERQQLTTLDMQHERVRYGIVATTDKSDVCGGARD